MPSQTSKLFRFIRTISIGSILAITIPASICHGEGNLKYGANIRIYQEFRKNTFDKITRSLKDEDFLRLSTSLWGSYEPKPDMKGYIKLTNESKYYLESPNPDNRHLKTDDVFIENLFLELKNIAALPVDLKAGRQNITYGEGFVVYDGTANDRDRSIYFNAIKTTWRFHQDHSIDMVYINDPKTDKFLPTLYSADNTGSQYQGHKRILEASDEQGVVVYSKNTIANGINLEPYYIYKKEDRISASIPELDLHTIGVRAVYERNGWRMSSELAGQFGEYEGGRDRDGYGAYLSARRTMEDALWKPRFELTHVNLSGDNPNSSSHEGWDPVFSRWVWLLKFYTQHYLPETGSSSYWTNLQLYRATTRLNFTPQTNLFVTYNYLRANETTKVTGPNTSFLSNDGKERGHLFQTKLSHVFNKYFDAYVAGEYFVPGNFYKLKNPEALIYWQLQFKVGS